jgi:hypothetical protein
MTSISLPLLYFYHSTTSQDTPLATTPHVSLLIALGILITGPYSLITSSVSVSLGEHPALGKDASAMATVSAIIDGFGSLGSINSGILITLISRIGAGSTDGGKSVENWTAVFILLMICACASSLFLIRIVSAETGYFQSILTLGSYIFRCCLCKRGNTNDPDHRDSAAVSLELSDLSPSNKNRRKQKGSLHASGFTDDLDSLGYSNNPSAVEPSPYAHDDDSIGLSPQRRLDPKERYKKENKALAKEVKRYKDQLSGKVSKLDKLKGIVNDIRGKGGNNGEYRDGDDVDDNETRVDVSKLYASANKR